MKNKLFDERKYLYIVKAFAVISIVSAHCGNVSAEFIELNQMISRIVGSIGSIGVPIFYIVSGYLFAKNNKSFTIFFKSKITSLLIPWLLCGSAVYLYIALRNEGVSILSWVLWILDGGYLYYLTVIVIFYLIYFYTAKNRLFVYFTMVLSVASILATGLDLYDLIIPFQIDPYMNPFNWMLYFSIGLLIQKYDLMPRLGMMLASLKYLVLLSVLLFGSIIAIVCSGTILSYWKIFFIPVEAMAFLVVLGWAYVLSQRESGFYVSIGLESFSIYLLHFPFAGLVANLLNRIDLWWTTPLRPLIVLIITVLGIRLYKYAARKLRIEKGAGILIGTRL